MLGPVRSRIVLCLLAIACLSPATFGQESAEPSDSVSATAGYEVLRSRPFLPPDFDRETLEKLWKVWPTAERNAARDASPDDRLRMIRERYGLTSANDEHGDLLGYVKTADGYVMNCLSCHGGQIEGKPIPGLGNADFSLQTLTEDVRSAKLAQRKRLSHLDRASLTMPLATTDGTTNAVVFGIVLGAFRRADMSVDTSQLVPKLVHHDVDAPALWNTSLKRSLYIDGFAPKNHRVIMQFMLIPQNDRDTVLDWEDDFKNVLAWIESLEPPPYPKSIDEPLAKVGRRVFDTHCATCHGTYSPTVEYPERLVPWEEVRTDRVRLDALNREHREWMRDSWMSRHGKDSVNVDPGGYVAPPLRGVWATAPYFHNGSVPTLWHVLHPQERPTVWRRSPDRYDWERIGPVISEEVEIPDSVTAPRDRRRYFDTRLRGKSAAGHDFANELTEEERRAVLEYLKTL